MSNSKFFVKFKGWDKYEVEDFTIDIRLIDHMRPYKGGTAIFMSADGTKGYLTGESIDQLLPKLRRIYGDQMVVDDRRDENPDSELLN